MDDMTAGWKTNFEQAVKQYFNIPFDAEITIEEECYYSEGCPTCGGDYEWTVRASWYTSEVGPRGGKAKPRYQYKEYNGKLIDFIQSLPR